MKLRRAAFFLTCGSVVSVLFSIAVCQILLALAFAVLLISGERVRFPPIKLPLALFFAGTVISLLLSADPAGGRPQVRKFFVYLILLLVYSTFRTVRQIRAVIAVWGGVAALSALRSLVQFVHKYQESRELHKNFYDYYVSERITGFMSNWMTFGGEEMMVVLMLGALLLLAPGLRARWRAPLWCCEGILLLSMLLGFTRSIWLGTTVGGLYLLWFWKRWMVAAVPAVLGLAFLVSPWYVRERVISAVRPHGDVDSNQFRVVTRRTGIEMAKAHPWFGIGPEQVKPQFERYVPPDIPRPLPTGWYGHLHNIYIHYAAERGIPTMLALMWMLGKIGYDFARAVRGAPAENRFVLHGALAVLLAMLAVGYYELNLGDSEVLTMFLAVVGFGYIAREDTSVQPAPA